MTEDDHQYSPGQYTRTFIAQEDIIPLMDLSFLQEENDDIKETITDGMDHMDYLNRHITPREYGSSEQIQVAQDSPEDEKEAEMIPKNEPGNTQN